MELAPSKNKILFWIGQTNLSYLILLNLHLTGRVEISAYASVALSYFKKKLFANSENHLFQQLLGWVEGVE